MKAVISSNLHLPVAQKKGVEKMTTDTQVFTDTMTPKAEDTYDDAVKERAFRPEDRIQTLHSQIR